MGAIEEIRLWDRENENRLEQIGEHSDPFIIINCIQKMILSENDGKAQ